MSALLLAGILELKRPIWMAQLTAEPTDRVANYVSAERSLAGLASSR